MCETMFVNQNKITVKQRFKQFGSVLTAGETLLEIMQSLQRRLQIYDQERYPPPDAK